VRQRWPLHNSERAAFNPAVLIGIKDHLAVAAILHGEDQMEVVMPIDSMLVTAAVVTMFAIFAGALVWGERQTRPLEQETAASQRKRRGF
jgi:hypothetical protein